MTIHWICWPWNFRHDRYVNECPVVFCMIGKGSGGLFAPVENRDKRKGVSVLAGIHGCLRTEANIEPNRFASKSAASVERPYLLTSAVLNKLPPAMFTH